MQEYKKLIGPISIISIAYLSSRILGFLREVLLAKWTGVSSASDTLDLAFIIPDFLFYLSAGGYLAITLIPILSDIKKKDSESLNDYFLSLLFGLSIIFIFISTVFFLFKNEISLILEVQNQALFSKLLVKFILMKLNFYLERKIKQTARSYPGLFSFIFSRKHRVKKFRFSIDYETQSHYFLDSS